MRSIRRLLLGVAIVLCVHGSVQAEPYGGGAYGAGVYSSSTASTAVGAPNTGFELQPYWLEGILGFLGLSLIGFGAVRLARTRRGRGQK